MSDHNPANEVAENAISVENTTKSRLYALIIGINTYPNITPLKGAVNDADEVSRFLTSDLKVPLDHIINLRNETASRANIIKSLRDLRDDQRIKQGDPILVYYAGHGGSHEPSKKLTHAFGSAKIQVIFPHDYKTQPPGATEPINCIPDKTIAVLLKDISAAKGDNLTVIFDCCHSASATRGDALRQSRNAATSMDIPDNIDLDILSARPGPISPAGISRIKLPFKNNDSSHIHFAACGDEEKAWEEGDRGAFTVALLKNIRAHGVDKITYHDLAISLPNLPRQSPHCYGDHTSRVLFNGTVPSRKVVFIPVKFEGGAIMLQAGAASGVTYKSVWELHDSPTSDSPSLGLFRAKAPKVSTVELEPTLADQPPSQELTGQLYARQVGHGTGNELKVWFSPEARIAIFESSGADAGAAEPGSSENEVGYVIHNKQDSADLVVALRDSEAGKVAVFHLNDSRAVEYGVATLGYYKPARRSEVEKVLFAVAKWHWHLHRKPEAIRSNVTIEFVKLTNGDDSEGDEKWEDVPVDSHKVLDSATGLMDLVFEPEVPYGLKISNSWNIPLYIRVFYFSSVNFAIDALTGSIASSSRTDADLPSRGCSIIGRDMGAAIKFEQDVELELGYFKVFWSTDPFYLDIDQMSPFDEPLASGSEPKRYSIEKRPPSLGNWGVASLALVLRAP